MIVTGVRVDTASCFVLESKLKLLRAGKSDNIAWKQRSIVRNDDRHLVFVFNVDRSPIKVIAVRGKGVSLWSLLHDRIHRQHNSVAPSLDGNLQLSPLAGPIAPGNITTPVRLPSILFDLIGKRDVEMKRS